MGLESSKVSSYPLNPNYKECESENFLPNNEKYRKMIGILSYIAVNSRPDIPAAVSILARSDKRRLDRNQNSCRIFERNNNHETFDWQNKTELCFYGYADTNWANKGDEIKSNSGFVFKLNGDVVSWCCRKQSCVALSSTEAELFALTECFQGAKWLLKLIKYFTKEVQSPVVDYEDNQSCQKMIASEKFCNTSKHIDTKCHFVKDYISKGMIKCGYYPSEEQLADMLTKPLTAPKLARLREKCGFYNHD